MTVGTLSVLCANCGGDELLSRLLTGKTSCPWCGLDFDDDFAPPRGLQRVLLPVVLTQRGAG